MDSNMDTKLYLIHGDDYIKHIEQQMELYDLLLTAMQEIRELLLAGKAMEAVRAISKNECQAHELFRSCGIPDSYLLHGKPESLRRLMEQELLPADNDDNDREEGKQGKKCWTIDHVLDMANTLADAISQMSHVCGTLLDDVDTMLDTLMEEDAVGA